MKKKITKVAVNDKENRPLDISLSNFIFLMMWGQIQVIN